MASTGSISTAEIVVSDATLSPFSDHMEVHMGRVNEGLGVTDRVAFGVEEEAILYEGGRKMVFEVAAEFGRDGFG